MTERDFAAAGLLEEDLHLLGRVLGQSSRRTAEAIVDVVSRALAQPGDTESDVALRMADQPRPPSARSR